MIFIKKGVRIHGIRPEVVFALVIVAQVFSTFDEDLVITSVIDGRHMRGSLHYVGAAFDVQLPLYNNEGARQRLAEALGAEFDVVLEDTHIHVEWQPKEPY